MGLPPHDALPAAAGPFIDGELALVLERLAPEDLEKGWVPFYQFAMNRGGERVGRIVLRVGATLFLENYAGHIGYTVEAAHRGRRYAARSVRLLLPFARELGYGELWITCDPSNVASRRSCEIAGATFVEIVDLPVDCDMYRAGDRQRCRYRIALA